MSAYTKCSTAARALVDDWTLRPANTHAPAGVWTEHDVLFLAAREDGGWDKATMDLAMRDAGQAVRRLYEQCQIDRFGLVVVPGIDMNPDFVRIATKIVYTNAETGPRAIRTPNGIFPRVDYNRDIRERIGKVGQGKGSRRDDLTPWGEQNGSASKEQQEILRLRAMLAARDRRIRELEAMLRQKLAKAS